MAIPSEVCEGDAVTLRCEVLVTVGNLTELVTATFTRDGSTIRSDTPNHMFLITGIDVIGVVVSDVTLSDDGVEYICTASGAPFAFESSLILNVTGMYIHSYVTTYVATYYYSMRLITVSHQ